jgi:NAD+ diphosphatase
MINEILPHVFDNAFSACTEIMENDYILCYYGNKILLRESNECLDIPVVSDFGKILLEDVIFLFSLNSRNCFLWQTVQTEDSSFTYHDIWSVRSLGKQEHAWIGILGLHIMNWYDSNVFCGRCGSKTKPKKDERAIICYSCQNVIYPRISPAIIVAITCGDRILLAKGAHHTFDFYALIAGYADFGESLEETVIREVKEEIGIDVKNIRYYKSHPWPFSGSLMVGFFAEADDTQPLVINEAEIKTAAWFTRGNLPPYASTISISGDMIEAFEKGSN